MGDVAHQNGDPTDASDADFTTSLLEAATTEHIEMDDSELDAMAVELRDEPYAHAFHMSTSPLDVNIDDDDLGDMANELEAERMTDIPAGIASVIPPSNAAAMPRLATRRPGVMPSMLSSSMNASALATGIGPAQVSRASACPRASFSTKVAPARNSFPVGGKKGDFNFETAFGAHSGERWRCVVREDEKRMASAVHGPLSRGYKGESLDVPPLSLESAIGMALEDAKKVSIETQLPPGFADQLTAVIKENGPLYLREVEQTARARLATDPDFDPSIFPATVKRFVQMG